MSVITELAAQAEQRIKIDRILAEARARAHHSFSASSLQALEGCPGFASESGESTASAAGTLQHYAVESGDFSVLDETQEVIVKKVIAYRESVAARWPGAKRLRETLLQIDALDTLDKGTSGGYLDFALVSADQREAHLMDWKFGLWEVEPAETNLQGYVYALGLRFLYPQLRKITVEFVMPYLGQRDNAIFTDADFPRMYARVCAVVARGRKARELLASKQTASQVKLVPRDLCCVFCANLGTCQSAIDLMLKVAYKFSPLALPPDITPSLITDATNAAIGMKLQRTVKAWAIAYSRQAAARAVEDEALIPEGYKLVSRADRKIADEPALLAMLKAMNLTDVEINATRSFTLAGLATLVRATAPKGSKEATEKLFFQAAETNKWIGREDPVTFLQAKREKLDE